MKPDSTKKEAAQNAAESATRRHFLTAGALAAPMVLPVGVYGAASKPVTHAPVRFGLVGVAGMGKHHIRVSPDHIGALCDVDQNHLKEGLELLGRDVPCYSDYRRLLEQQDLDGVMIATPDWWHALITIHACEAGKDVYVEKPASKYVKEGRAMVHAARAADRIVKVGSQGRCHPAAAAAKQFIQSGAIGKITHVECWHKDNYVGGAPDKISAPPDHLDWEMWLGSLPKRAYNPDYAHRFNRRMFDMGGGQIMDRGPHAFSLVSWIMGLDRTGPSKVTASGNPPTEGLWNCPLNFEATYEFDKPDFKIHWKQPGVKAGDFEFGAVYYGTGGKTVVSGGDGRVFADEQVAEFARARGIPVTLEQGVRTHKLHHDEWMPSIRTREKPIMDIEAGHRVATMCSLANIAYQVERPLRWDAKREKILDDPGADALLGSPGRGVYRIT